MERRPVLIKPIVSIEEWVNSEYYIGDEIKTINEYPLWKQETINFFNSNHISYILFGSYRVGKNQTSALWVKRIAYEISCYEDFPLFFNLSASTRLKIAWLSFSITKAKDTGIKKITRMIDSTPYFQEECPRNYRINSRIEFPFLEIIFASNVSHLTGEDLFGCVFDEADFVKSAAGDEYEKAKDLYTEAQVRGALTYSVGGVHYGFYGLLSSALYETSFTEQMIKKAKKDKSAFVVEANVYNVKPSAFSSEKFKVFVGLDEVDPHYIESPPANVITLINRNYGLTYDQFLVVHKDKIIEVPIDLKKFYDDDIIKSIQTISGISMKRGRLLLKNLSIFNAMFENNTLRSPLLQDTPTLSLFDDDTIEDFVDEEILMSNYEDGKLLYIHLDLSRVKDNTGFGAVYKSDTGKIRTLLYCNIQKKPDREEIDISKVEAIIYWLIDIGCNIGFVSYDYFAKDYISQNLKKRLGKERVGYISMDRDDSGYMIFLFLMKKKMIEAYDYKPFREEFVKLEHDPSAGRVDHPAGSDKASCDVFSGSVFSLFTKEGMSREDLIGEEYLKKMDVTDSYNEDYYGNIMENVEEYYKTEKGENNEDDFVQVKDQFESYKDERQKMMESIFKLR